MSLTTDLITQAKNALRNPLLPIELISRKLFISRPTLYRLQRGKIHPNVSIPPDTLPERDSGGEPLHRFLSYFEVNNGLQALKERKKQGSFVRFNDQAVRDVKVINEAIPFIRMRSLAAYYDISEVAIHNLLSGYTYTGIDSSYNKVMELQKVNFLNGQPFTNQSRINSNTQNAMHG